MRSYFGAALSRHDLKSIKGGAMRRAGCIVDAGMCSSDSATANRQCNTYCNNLCNWNNCGHGLGSCLLDYCICGCSHR